MIRSLLLPAAVVMAAILAGCTEAPQRPAPVEDRTSQPKPPTTSSTLARPPAPAAAPSKPPVAVVKPLAIPAEPKLIPIPVPESAPTALPPAAQAPAATAPASTAPAPGMELAAIPPPVTSNEVPAAASGSSEGGRQYRPSAAVGELLNKAKALEQKRDFPGAITILERGVQVAPNDPMLWHQLARMRFANGELPQAKRLAERSNSLARSYPAITAGNWMVIGQVEKLAGHADAAARAFSNAQPAPATP